MSLHSVSTVAMPSEAKERACTADESNLLRSFLQKARELALQPSAHGSDLGSLHVVMGNEACDLDSVACAICYALFVHTTRGDKTCVPYLNIPREELPLRQEVLHVLSRAGIDPAVLLFKDDLDLQRLVTAKSDADKHAKANLTLTLVDHNRLASTQEDLAPYVIGIIDHHADEKLYAATTTALRVIQPVGSASTLVAQRIHMEAPALLKRADVATLLLAAILLDTGNMDPALRKGTATDANVIRLLTPVCFPGVSTSADSESRAVATWYRELLRLRTDTSLLNTAQLLLKDVKYTVHADKIRFAISSVPLSLNQWIAQDEANFLPHIRTFIGAKNLSFLVIMTTFTDDDQLLHRELMVIATSEAMLRAVTHSLLKEDRELRLEGRSLQLVERLAEYERVHKDVGLQFAIYDQLDVSKSRKQVLPAILHSL